MSKSHIKREIHPVFKRAQALVNRLEQENEVLREVRDRVSGQLITAMEELILTKRSHDNLMDRLQECQQRVAELTDLASLPTATRTCKHCGRTQEQHTTPYISLQGSGTA